ncbi:protein decapentaplegic-like [Ischnura elegans]|uniref:protein decapentaplegic-like n=1 Tax=Ischnura elegans TaxID=197161 RepID=UPI001ED892BF|nr:protein decapentaplegic-like [Ischnura elegans]
MAWPLLILVPLAAGQALAACWPGRTDPCLPIPRAMMQLLEDGGGEDVVRAVLPTRAVRVPEFGKPKIRTQRHKLTFKIPDTKIGERLKSAELRISLPWNLSGQRTFGKSSMAHVFLVPKKEDRHRQSTIRLDSIPMNHHRQELNNSSLVAAPTLSLNVTAALFPGPQSEEARRMSLRSNGLLHLEVHLQGEEGATISMFPEEHVLPDPPQLLLFYTLGDKRAPPSSRRKGRVRRTIQEEYEEETNMIWSRVPELPRFKELSGAKKKPPRNSCRRQPLYVDFAEINYDTWIVAPDGYEAYQCVGKCFFPVSEHLSPTKHAILQTLVHSVSPRKASRACCVPTRLESISVLYVDQNGVLTYHFSYEDMVVAECGCR